jgi:cytochrome b561
MVTNPARYNAVAMSLHWLIAALMIPMLFFGEELMEMEDGTANTFLPSLHVSIGTAILLLTVLRLAWRFFNPPPPPPLTMAGWEKAAATVTHVLFYALMIGLPLSGWMSFPEFLGDEPGLAGVSIFGAFPVPAGPDGGELAGEIHEIGSKAGIALVILHVAAALKHHFLNRDDVLRRMLPSKLG